MFAFQKSRTMTNCEKWHCQSCVTNGTSCFSIAQNLGVKATFEYVILNYWKGIMYLVMFLIQDQCIWCVSFKASIDVFFPISYLIKNHISYKNFPLWEICNTFVDHGHV